jgi:hypothetical protein
MITILFKTDFRHSYASRDIIGVFTNKSLLRRACMKLIKEDLTDNSGYEGQELKNYIKYNFDFMFSGQNQTQGLSSFELVIEEIKSNEII